MLELHSKTVITFAGFFISIAGWFLWNLALSGIYSQQLGIYLVRDGFLDNFGRQLCWWASILLGLATLTVIELVVQAIRRVYWPTDQDLMQRIEKDARARSKMQASALAAEKGETDTLDIQDAVGGSDDRSAKVPWVDRVKAKASAASNSISKRNPPPPPAPRRSSQERYDRMHVRASHDDYQPPNFTPPAEERENPFETAPQSRDGHDA